VGIHNADSDGEPVHHETARCAGACGDVETVATDETSIQLDHQNRVVTRSQGVGARAGLRIAVDDHSVCDGREGTPQRWCNRMQTGAWDVEGDQVESRK